MGKKYNVDTDKKYISERLLEKMQTIKKYPLTVIEAPLGYGKTVCTEEYLKRIDADYMWQSVFDPSVELFWKKFCRSLSRIDEGIAERVRDSGYPSDSVKAVDLAEIIGQAQSSGKDIFWVIDDYHKVMNEKLDRLFEMIARENNVHLHIILLSRAKFTYKRDELIIKKLMLEFNDEDLTLTENECKEFFDGCGASVSITQNRHIYEQTGGWMTAVNMVMQSFVDTGELSIPPIVFSMFENAVYGDFSDDKKDFLMRVCIFDRFTKEQARFIRRKYDPGKLLQETVDNNEFVKFDEKRRIYHIQVCFTKFLRSKLSQCSVRYQKEVYRHAADWFWLNGRYFNAAVCYYKSSNFKDMLRSFERDKGEGMSRASGETMIKAFRACPKDMRLEHPIANMIFAKQFFLMEEKELLHQALEEIEFYIKNSDLSLRERDEINGEYEMLKFFISYNDMDAMNAHCREAAKLLKKPTKIIAQGESCAFGCPSVFFMFYKQRGSLESLKNRVYESCDLYYKLTGNNSKGFEYLLEGEIELYHGNFERSEIFAYKAYSVALKYDHTGMQLSALFLQVRAMMIMGNHDEGFSTFQQMRKIADESGNYLYTQMVDLCIPFIYSYYNQLKPTESWIIESNYTDTLIYEPLRPFYAIAYSRICIVRGLYTKFMGLYGIMMQDAEKYGNMLTMIHLNVYAAISCDRLGMEEDAEDHLRNAVEMAYPDDLVVTFILNGKELKNIGKKNSFNNKQWEFIEKCRGLYDQYKDILNSIVREEDSSILDMLTKREREIAFLVADGKTNIEIARELHLAEITVKKSLSSIYSRLDVSNRTSLMKKINNK